MQCVAPEGSIDKRCIHAKGVMYSLMIDPGSAS